MRLLTRAVAPTLLGQAASSLLTALLFLAAARQGGAELVGALALGHALYLALAGVNRAVCVDPLLVGDSARVDAAEEDARASFSCALALAGFLSIASCSVALVAGDLPAWLQMASAGALVGLPMDLVRGRLYQVGKGAAACVGDIAALLAGCLLFAFSIRANTASPPLFVAAWCVALSVGMVIMSAVLRLRPASLTSSIIWFRRDSMPLAKWLLAEAGAFHAGAFGTALAIQLFAGPAALGGLRVVQTLFAPLTLISPALSQAGLPRVVAALSSSTQRARDEAVRFTCVAVGLTALYIFASLSVPNLLPALFGASFKAFTDLIFPVALAQVVGAGGLMSFLLLRALRAGRAIATARLVGSSLSVLAAACTLPFAGIEGATWSLAASSIGGVAFSTFLMWKATQPLAARDLPRIGAVSEVVIKS